MALQTVTLSVQIHSQQSTTDLLASMHGFSKQIGRLEVNLEARQAAIAEGDRPPTYASSAVSETNLKVFNNMQKTVKSADALVTATSVNLANGIRSTVLSASEHGGGMSEQHRAIIDDWVPSPVVIPSTASVGEESVITEAEPPASQRGLLQHNVASIDQTPAHIRSMSSTGNSSNTEAVARPQPAQSIDEYDDDLQLDVELMVKLFDQGKQEHLKGEIREAASSFRKAFEQMTRIRSVPSSGILIDDSTLSIAFLTLDHQIWKVTLEDFEPLMASELLSKSHRLRAKHLVAHHLLRTGRTKQAEVYAKSSRKDWRKLLKPLLLQELRSHSYDGTPGGRSSAYSKPESIFSEDSSDSRYRDVAVPASASSDSSGEIQNLFCYQYALKSMPVAENNSYLRWAYYDSLSLLIRILSTDGESPEAKVLSKDIPEAFYRPGEFEFIELCDKMERTLYEGNTDRAAKMSLTHLQYMLSPFEISDTDTESIALQIRQSEGCGLAGKHDGYTALHALASRGRRSSTRLLLSKGCNARPKASCETPFMLAAKNGHFFVARLFGDYKNGIRAGDARRALPYAISNWSPDAADLFEYLLERFDLTNPPAQYDKSLIAPPICQAIAHSNIEAFKILLLQPRIDIDQLDPATSQTPLWLAARLGEIAILEEILSRTDPAQEPGDQQMNPLLAAVHAYAITKQPVRLLKLGPPSGETMTTLCKVDRLSANSAAKCIPPDEKSARDFATIEEALKILADRRWKDESSTTSTMKILLGSYNIPQPSDDDLAGIIKKTKKFKNMCELGQRRSSSTSLMGRFKTRKPSQPSPSALGPPTTSNNIPSPPSPATRTPTLPPSATRVPTLPSPPHAPTLTSPPKLPSPPLQARGRTRTLPEHILNSPFVQHHLRQGEGDEEVFDFIHG